MPEEENRPATDAVVRYEDSHKSSEQIATPQTDQGWAWMVLLGATVENFVVIGAIRAFGLFFVEFLVVLNAPASTLSMALSLQTILFSVLSMLIIVLGDTLDVNRGCVMLGGLLAWLSYFISSFATTGEVLLVTFGVIFGTAAAFIHGPSTVVVGKYFTKRRGMANAVMNLGGSVGGLALPGLFRFLLDTYALQGALWIVSALFLNVMVSGALFRPMIPQIQNINTTGHNQGKGNVNEKDVHEVVYIPGEERKHGVAHSYDSLINTQMNRQQNKRIEQHTERTRTLSDSSMEKNVHDSGLKSHFCKTSELTQGLGDALGSLGNIHLSKTFADDRNHDDEDGQYSCIRHCPKMSWRKILKDLFDVELFKNNLFTLFLISSFASVCGLALIGIYLPHHAKDVGMSDKQTTLLLSIIGATDLVNRILLAFIADHPRVSRPFLVGSTLVITGIATLLMQLCTEFWSLAIYSGVYGGFHGTYFSLLAVLVVDFAGIENLSKGLAMTMFSHGVSIVVFNIIIGAIRDNLHTYIPAFYIMGGCMVVAGLMYFFEPAIRRYNKRKEREIASEA